MIRRINDFLYRLSWQHQQDKEFDAAMEAPHSKEYEQAVALREQWWKHYWAEQGLSYPAKA